MLVFPLSESEDLAVLWASRLMPLGALLIFVLLGSLSLAVN